MTSDGGNELTRLREELRRAHEELAAERALRRAAIDNSPDFVMLSDLNGRLRFINRLAPGYRLEDVLGAPMLSFIPPRYHDDVTKAITRTIATGEVAIFETMVDAGGPTPNHFINRIAPVRTNEGITGVVWLSTDIERLVRAEEEVRERDDRLRIIIESSRMGVWSIDLDAGTAHADDRASEIFGQAGEPMSMESALSVVPPEERALIYEAIGNARKSGKYGPIDHRVVHPSGVVRWVRTVGQVHRDADGAHRLTGGVMDITDQRSLEIELAQAQRLDSIGRLAGGVAHDFNNLLTAMFGSIDLARSILPQDSPVQVELGELHSCAQRGATLTAQLLAFARRQVMEPRVITLSGLVGEIEKLLRRVLGEDVELATMCEASGRVRVDPHQIERVLVNLATNARDAMPRGGRLTLETVDVELDEPYATAHAEVVAGRYVMLAVSDTGLGIAHEDLPHIFEPFFTTKGAADGTGLGLATCYGIVRQAGGYIHAYSEPGHGTTFRIYLPRVDDPVEPRVGPEPPRKSTGHETILVVEDDPIVRRVTVRGLTRLGYTVLEASNGEEALEIADREGPIDLLLTDVVMPRMSGRELAERLREVQPGTIVLFASGYTANAIVHHGVLDAGIEFLPKPFSIAVLNARIRQLLDAR
ncbi:MAG TPA: PAS domain S-box protein [Nannocystaceae bacterium]|nr:PAS domain S-box protein [Nannocystaceae bacterium]